MVIGKEFDKLMKKKGQGALLIRSSILKPCSCVNMHYRVAKSDCNLCFGTGYVSSIERITLRHNTKKLNTDVVSLVQGESTAYVSSSVRPNKCDLLIIGDIKSIQYATVYEVKYVEPKYDGDNIAYFELTLKENGVNKSIRIQQIKDRLSTNKSKQPNGPQIISIDSIPYIYYNPSIPNINTLDDKIFVDELGNVFIEE